MRARFSIAAAIVVALLAGCAGGTADCGALPERYELTLGADTLTPSDPAVCRGDEVTLVVHSEVDGTFHIHGYDAHIPATGVVAGETLELSFTAARSGQFPIELHSADSPRGVGVGILTVHEP